MNASALQEITTVTIFGLKPGNLRWGLSQMGLMPRKLKNIPGLKFYKMLGSGRGLGFSMKPEFYRYGLLCVWKTENDAHSFFSESEILKVYMNHTFESWTIWLNTMQAYGLWDGIMPFSAAKLPENYAGPIAALTRASIWLTALPTFWKHVPQTSNALKNAEGLLASIGLGELPFIRQATFSVWENAEALKKYAYGNKLHREVIAKTRKENWYKEELFARFIPVKSEGLWQGKNPVLL